MEVIGILFVLGILGSVAVFLDWHKPAIKWFVELGPKVGDWSITTERTVRQYFHDRKVRQLKDKETELENRGKIRDGRYVNRSGTREYLVENGRFRTVNGQRPKVGSEEFFAQPTVQNDLSAMRDIFRMQTIRAIDNGTTPPEQVGFGRHTRDSLRRVWDFEWEALAERMDIKLFEYKVVGKQAGTPSEVYGWVDYVEPKRTLKFEASVDRLDELTASYSEMLESTKQQKAREQFNWKSKPPPPSNVTIR